MKICYLDANLLVYIGNTNSPFHKKSLDAIIKLTDDRYELVLSSLSLDEYFHTSLRFSQDSRQVAFKSLTRAYKKLLKLPNIRLINPPLEAKKHLKALNFMEKFNLHSRDAYHLFIMVGNKVKYLATFDSDFEKVFEKGLIKQFI